MKKASGEEYSEEECRGFLDNIDKINTIIKLELESRIEGLNHDEKMIMMIYKMRLVKQLMQQANQKKITDESCVCVFLTSDSIASLY